MRGKTVLLVTKNGFPPQFDFLSACQKTMFLTRSMQDEGIHPAWQGCGNDFSALCSEKSPPPDRQSRSIRSKKKGLQPFFASCFTYRDFSVSQTLFLCPFWGTLWIFWDSFLMLLRFSGEGAE